jgi:hypothetical protein
MPEELLMQMTPEEEARYRKKIRSQMIGAVVKTILTTTKLISMDIGIP